MAAVSFCMKPTPVGQPGQRIHLRQPQQAPLFAFLRGDVLPHDVKTGDRDAVVAHLRYVGHFERALGPFGAVVLFEHHGFMLSQRAMNGSSVA
ncbi:hypothetical protein LP420_34665 [Massilia sp. B-10]|nr:hypothetical protein LP420_34665 [Massilia sp. B-10]